MNVGCFLLCLRLNDVRLETKAGTFSFLLNISIVSSPILNSLFRSRVKESVAIVLWRVFTSKCGNQDSGMVHSEKCRMHKTLPTPYSNCFTFFVKILIPWWPNFRSLDLLFLTTSRAGRNMQPKERPASKV